MREFLSLICTRVQRNVRVASKLASNHSQHAFVMSSHHSTPSISCSESQTHKNDCAAMSPFSLSRHADGRSAVGWIVLVESVMSLHCLICPLTSFHLCDGTTLAPPVMAEGLARSSSPRRARACHLCPSRRALTRASRACQRFHHQHVGESLPHVCAGRWCVLSLVGGVHGLVIQLGEGT